MLRSSTAAVGGSEHNFGFDNFLTETASFFHKFYGKMIIFQESWTVQLMHIRISFLRETFWNKRGLEYSKRDLSHFMQ